MPPEQKEKKPEEIVRNTGWGFLINKSTESPKLKPDQMPPAKPVPPDAPPPPPATDH